jgi:PAS domain S-box-containing protein
MSAPSPPEGQHGSEHPADVVFIVRADGEIRFANRPHGGLSEDDLVGTSIFEWIAPSHRDVLRQGLEEVFTAGQPRALDLSGPGPTGGEAWYEWRLKPNRRDGAVVSATLVGHDITRHMRAVHELEQKANELTSLLEDRSADLARAKADLAKETEEREASQLVWQRFRAILDEAGEAIFITEPDSRRIVDANETACRWLRHSREELIGHSIDEFNIEFPIQPPEEAELTFTETRDSRRPLVLNHCVHRRSDGSTFPVEVAVARHELAGREYVLAVVRDVKGRTFTEETLQQADAQYRRLFEQSWDAIYLTSRDGKIVDANEAALTLFGYSREEFVGLDARHLFPRGDDIREFRRTMSAAGAVDDLEVEIRTKAGHSAPCLLSASRRLAPDGSISGYQCLVRQRGAPDEQVAPGASRAGKRRAVLVVETDAVQLAHITSVLEAAGVGVLTAESPERAVELFREHSGVLEATLLAADPGSDSARRAIETIRYLDEDAPVILLSSAAPVRMAESFADLGIAAFLKKPVHPLALAQKVREVARR